MAIINEISQFMAILKEKEENTIDRLVTLNITAGGKEDFSKNNMMALLLKDGGDVYMKMVDKRRKSDGSQFTIPEMNNLNALEKPYGTVYCFNSHATKKLARKSGIPMDCLKVLNSELLTRVFHAFRVEKFDTQGIRKGAERYIIRSQPTHLAKKYHGDIVPKNLLIDGTGNVSEHQVVGVVNAGSDVYQEEDIENSLMSYPTKVFSRPFFQSAIGTFCEVLECHPSDLTLSKASIGQTNDYLRVSHYESKEFSVNVGQTTGIDGQSMADVLGPCISIRNSEFGEGATSIDVGIERLVCKNGMIGISNLSSFNLGEKISLSRQKAFFETLKPISHMSYNSYIVNLTNQTAELLKILRDTEYFKYLENTIIEKPNLSDRDSITKLLSLFTRMKILSGFLGFDYYKEGVTKAIEIELKKFNEQSFSEMFAKKIGLCGKESLLTAFRAEKDLGRSQFMVAQAISRVANAVSDTDRSISLQRIATECMVDGTIRNEPLPRLIEKWG